MALHIRIDTPRLLDLQTDLDFEWVKANVDDPQKFVGKTDMDARNTIVRDMRTGEYADINDLWNRAMQGNPTEAGAENSFTFHWDDARLEAPDWPALRVRSMKFSWKIEKGKEPITTIMRAEPFAIVRDAIDGTLLFVDPHGRITGDTDDEFGRKK